MLARSWGELALESINNQSCSPSFCLQSKTLKHLQHIQYSQVSFTAFSSVPQFNTSFFTFHKPPAKMQLSTPLLLFLLLILSTLHPTIAYLIAASTFSGSGCTDDLMDSIDFECSIGDVCSGCVNSAGTASIAMAGLSGDDLIALGCSQCSTCDYNDDCTSTIASACLALDGAHGGWGDITMVQTDPLQSGCCQGWLERIRNPKFAIREQTYCALERNGARWKARRR
jgi:hypothetical protein